MSLSILEFYFTTLQLAEPITIMITAESVIDHNQFVAVVDVFTGVLRH